MHVQRVFPSIERESALVAAVPPQATMNLPSMKGEATYAGSVGLVLGRDIQLLPFIPRRSSSRAVPG